MTTKRFIRLQLIFVVMLALSIVCSTFSWAPRPTKQGGGFMSITNTDVGSTALTKDKTYYTAMALVTPARGYYVNGNECTGNTYRGQYNAATGKIDYSTTPITSVSESLSPGEIVYLKTEITNSAAINTNVSLYIHGKYRQNIQDSFRLGLTEPFAKETFLTPDNQQNDGTYLNFKWLPVVAQYEIDENETAYIEWYVYNNHSTTTGLFEISKIIMTNN